MHVFDYILVIELPEHGRGSKLKHITEEGLLTKLEDTGYCRNGYRQLETQSRRSAMNILGECYDKASDTDREKFPNPEPKKLLRSAWVKALGAIFVI